MGKLWLPRRAPDSLLRAGEELGTMGTCLSLHPLGSLTCTQPRTLRPLEWSQPGRVPLQVTRGPGKQCGHRGACGLDAGLSVSAQAQSTPLPGSHLFGVIRVTRSLGVTCQPREVGAAPLSAQVTVEGLELTGSSKCKLCLIPQPVPFPEFYISRVD